MGGDKPSGARIHRVEDHAFGAVEPHEHGPDADHDHDDLSELGALEDNPIWIQDNVILKSVGIDIGSSGTQIIFSRIHLRRHGEDLTSRYVVISREALYQSPIELTPYADIHRIDQEALGRIIDQAYGEARVTPDDIDTGVVILTGEALRRENAEAIARIVAERGGEFVCATAGNHMEAMLAAYGSGAARVSSETGQRLLNIDVGGGTTKLGIVENGKVLQTAALHIGGRLMVVDDSGTIVRLDPAGAHHADLAGHHLHLGDTVSPETMDAIASNMADILVDTLLSETPPDAGKRLYLTDPIDSFAGIEGIMVSGGVGEYVYGRETRDFGDMGRRLGQAIARRIQREDFRWSLLPAAECIRATALGASEYSVQLSGNTSYISNPRALLPRRNMQVIRPDLELGEDIDPQAVAQAIKSHFVAFDLEASQADVGLALGWQGMPSYERLLAFAKGIAAGLDHRLSQGLPVHILLDGDVAMTLGAILKEDVGVTNEILVIDGLSLRDFDFIDIGRIRVPSLTVPVTIKSLVFSETPNARRSERIHHHGHGHHHHHDHGHSHDHAHDHDHQHPHSHR